MKLEGDTIDTISKGLAQCQFTNLETLMIWMHEDYSDEVITPEHIIMLSNNNTIA